MSACSSASWTFPNSSASRPRQTRTARPSAAGLPSTGSSLSTRSTSQSAQCVTPRMYSHLQVGQIMAVHSTPERRGKLSSRDLAGNFPCARQILGAERRGARDDPAHPEFCWGCRFRAGRWPGTSAMESSSPDQSLRRLLRRHSNAGQRDCLGSEIVVLARR